MVLPQIRLRLDGSVSFQFRDPNLPPGMFSSQAPGGGSCTAWSTSNDNVELQLVTIHMNAANCQHLLARANQEEAAQRLCGHKWTFMWSNVSCHEDVKGSSILIWPAKSPDLNPMENCSGQLCRKVLAVGHQFGRVEDLESSHPGKYGNSSPRSSMQASRQVCSSK